MNLHESKEWQSARLVHVNVDVENDFLPGGSLAVNDGAMIIPNLNRLSQAVRTAGGTVVHTRDWHPAVTNHFVEHGGPWPVHCVAGTHGAAFHEDLDVNDSDVIISKGTLPDEDAYSGFQGADPNGLTLEQIITPRGSERVIMIVGGLATDYCVRATVLDGLRVAAAHVDSVKVIAATDAMKPVNINPNDGENAAREMKEAGAVLMTAQEIIEQLGRLGLVAV